MNVSWEYNKSNQNQRIDKIEDESEEKKENKDSKKKLTMNMEHLKIYHQKIMIKIIQKIKKKKKN